MTESQLDEDLDPHPCEEDEKFFKARPNFEEMEQATSNLDGMPAVESDQYQQLHRHLALLPIPDPKKVSGMTHAEAVQGCLIKIMSEEELTRFTQSTRNLKVSVKCGESFSRCSKVSVNSLLFDFVPFCSLLFLFVLVRSAIDTGLPRDCNGILVSTRNLKVSVKCGESFSRCSKVSVNSLSFDFVPFNSFLFWCVRQSTRDCHGTVTELSL